MVGTDRTRRRVVHALWICAMVLWASSPGKALVISEIMYQPSDEGEFLEFVELYNDRAVFEDLSGWTFTRGIEYTFEPETILGAKQYLVIARDPAALEAAYGITGVLGPFAGRLDNAGERVELSNASGAAVLSVRYDREPPWPAAPTGTGHSLVLATLAGDPDEPTSWVASSTIGGTPGGPDLVQVEAEGSNLLTLIDIGHPGRYFKGTREPSPDRTGRATTDWTQIEFNDDPATTDWLEGPSGYGYSGDPAHFQVIRTLLDDMRYNYVSVYARLPFVLTAGQIDSFAQLQAEVHYDDEFILYLNGVRVADSGRMPGDPPPFDHPSGQGWNPPAEIVDLTNRMDLLVVGTNVLSIQVHNASLGGSSDCIASPILRALVKSSEQADDPRARLVINELLTKGGTDWIEIYNPGPIPVDLRGVYLSDDPRNLLQYTFPDGIVLAPGEFWAVEQGTPPEGFGFGLSFAGETVYLTAGTNEPEPRPIRVMDAVRFGTIPPGMTFGRYPDGAADLGLLEAPTFAGPNTRPFVHDIVINEIMYHHLTADERFEYVELYNKGNETVSLSGWAFTSGIDYVFEEDVEMPPDSYLVIAQSPSFLGAIYSHLEVGVNVVGPYSGRLSRRSDRLRLSYPWIAGDETYMVTADEVTYYDGGRWPFWADGRGSSLELRDPRSDNNKPDAWADSDESGKTEWAEYSFTIAANDTQYTHDRVNVFDMMLLKHGEVLLDDIECIIDGINRLSNGGFESGTSSWRTLGNHVQSFVTTADSYSGSRALHLIAAGHGDPGANRVNQSISGVNAGTVTFRFRARWLRGSRYLLLRTTRERSPIQPPRPAYAFELDVPFNMGTPGLRNTAYVANRPPDIMDVRHSPVLPAGGEPIVVTARITDKDGVEAVMLSYRSEGGVFTNVPMVDDGSGDDAIAGDGVFTAAIPGAPSGTMRAFYIEAFDGAAFTRFPSRLAPTAEVPDRTCLVRVGETPVNSRFATYRIWLSNDVVSAFRSRPNLSNELLDCTFVYNDTDIFYNVGIRHRGSPFLRSGRGREPSPNLKHGFRIDFNPDQRFRDREEINLDGTEESYRGPLQERASYWFYQQMGLQFSRQEYVRPILNGRAANIYEDVQKIDGDYIDRWFPDDADGYIHKIDDYFEFNADGTSHSNLDEGLKYDSRHPLLKETYRWGFEKRSHRQNDRWDHLFDFAVAMNTPSGSASYERNIESVIRPEHFAAVLAIRHAVGDWDSYGYRRGKNNYFYYAAGEGKWYLLPWDIDFTLGSGDGPSTSLPPTNSGIFPEVHQFLNHPKYKQVYWDALRTLVEGPWQTSYGTNDPPTAFDRFLDDAADALGAEGFDNSRRNSIKQFVRSRRNYVLSQLPAEPGGRSR